MNLSHVKELLVRRLGDGLELVRWGTATAEQARVLVLAPQNYTGPERSEILGATDWAWTHLVSAGVDFLADCARPEHMLLTRTWRAYAAPIAEYVVRAILESEYGRARPWEPTAYLEEAGREPARQGLWGCNVGVAGWGEIGKRVGTVLSALGADVTALSLSSKPPGADSVRHTCSVHDLSGTEHLVVALPLTESTRGLISGSWMAGARQGMHVVNVGRAEVVDQAALARNCRLGHMTATLDVTSPEPLPADHPLATTPGVLVSPHVAWRSRDSDYAFVADLADVWVALREGLAVPGAALGSTADRARTLLA